MKPVSYYYSSRVNKLPEEFDEWLNQLPAINKMQIAKALLCQIDATFQYDNRPKEEPCQSQN